jgi:antitoxin HicB
MENNMLEKYLELPYKLIIIRDKESGTFTGKVLEFPGCISQGDTVDEVYKNLSEAAKSWIIAALDMGQEIPEPFPIEKALKNWLCYHQKSSSIAPKR